MPHNLSEKLLVLAGHCYYGFLIVLSLVFFKERLICFDSSYYLFKMMYYSDFYFAHNRYISFFPESIALLLIKAKASLPTLMKGYSASYMLFHYLCFVLMAHVFKNKTGAFFIALATCLTMRYKFYIAISEVTMTIFAMAFFIAWLNRPKDKWKISPQKQWFISLAILLLLLSGHSILLLIALTYFAFDMVFENRWKDKGNWLIIGLTLIGYFIKYQTADGYESGKISMLKHGLNLKVWKMYIGEMIGTYFTNEYIIPIIIMGGFWLWLLYRRKWLAALSIPAATLTLLFFIGVIFSSITKPVYNLVDGYLGMMGILWCLPMLYYFKTRPVEIWHSIALVGLLFFCMFRVYDKHDFFVERTNYVQQLIDENTKDGHRKIYISQKGFPEDKMWYAWGISLETMLLSALDGPENAATIFPMQKHDLKYSKEKNKDDLFLGAQFWQEEFNQPKLDECYFKLPRQQYKEGDFGWKDLK